MPRLLAILVLSTACGGPFGAARREGTAAAYGSFVANHPTHRKAPKAIERAELLQWEEAVQVNTASAYALYVVTHPTGLHVSEARERGEARAWDEAIAADTLLAYADYTSAYPKGGHRTEADGAVERLAVEEARMNDSVEGWGRYLYRFPDGQFTDEARGRRDTVAWEQALRVNERAAFEVYLEQNPNGEHRQEARSWLGSLAVGTLQPVLVIGSTWRPVSRRRADRNRLTDRLEGSLLKDLQTEFAMRPLRVEDAVAGDLAHPADRHGREPGVGLLVIEVSEEVGDVFEPSGHATRMPTTVSVYAAPTDKPLWSWSFTAGTPERLVGSYEESLYTEAVDAWEGYLGGVPIPVEQLTAPVVP